jgi:hypothetical protein
MFIYNRICITDTHRLCSDVNIDGKRFNKALEITRILRIPLVSLI